MEEYYNNISLTPMLHQTILIKLPKNRILKKIFAPSISKPYLFYLLLSRVNEYSLALYSAASFQMQILQEFEIGNQPKCKMIAEGCFVYLNLKRGVIGLINLIEKKKQEIQFQYLSKSQPLVETTVFGVNRKIQSRTSVDLFVFEESQQFCIVEQQQKRIKFSYFKWTCEMIKSFQMEVFSQKIFKMNEICRLGGKGYVSGSKYQFVEIDTKGTESIFKGKESIFQGTESIFKETESTFKGTESISVIEVKNRILLDDILNEIQKTTNRNISSQIQQTMLFQLSDKEFLIECQYRSQNCCFPMIIHVQSEYSEAIIKPLQLLWNNQPFELPCQKQTKVSYEEMRSYFLIKIKYEGSWIKREELLIVNKKSRNIVVIDRSQGCLNFKPLYRDQLISELTDSKSSKRVFQITDYEVRPNEAYLSFLLTYNDEFDHDLLSDCISLLASQQ